MFHLTRDVVRRLDLILADFSQQTPKVRKGKQSSQWLQSKIATKFAEN